MFNIAWAGSPSLTSARSLACAEPTRPPALGPPGRQDLHTTYIEAAPFCPVNGGNQRIIPRVPATYRSPTRIRQRTLEPPPQDRLNQPGPAFAIGYLAPFWPVILADYGAVVVLHLGLALVGVLASLYAIARAAGLSDLGRRVDLVERSVRRGEGDPELADALKRDTEGDWE